MKRKAEKFQKRKLCIAVEIAVYQQRKQVSKLCVSIYVFLSSNTN